MWKHVSSLYPLCSQGNQRSKRCNKVSQGYSADLGWEWVQCIYTTKDPGCSRSLSGPQGAQMRKIGSHIVPTPTGLSAVVVLSLYSSWEGSCATRAAPVSPDPQNAWLRRAAPRAPRRLLVPRGSICFWSWSRPVHVTSLQSWPLPWLLEAWEQDILKDSYRVQDVSLGLAVILKYQNLRITQMAY